MRNGRRAAASGVSMMDRRTLGACLAALAMAGSGSAIAQTGDYAAALEALGIQDSSGSDDVYVVVPGDTLWDICQSFFGDPDYWPTLWSINNEEITNPHYIYPGQALRFQPGTDTRPPSIIVDGQGGAFDNLSFDDNFQPLAPVFSTSTDCSLHMPFSAPSEGDVTLAAATFLARTPVDALGVIDAAEPGKNMLARGDQVYMRFRNTSDVNCGDVYSLYHHIKEVRHPEVRSARLGHAYQVSGEVLVTDVGERWVTGRLVQSFSEIERGELLTDRVPVAGRVRSLEMPQDVDGFVIDKAQQIHDLVHRNQVIFIDRGRNDGVQSGTVFWVVRRGDGLTTKAARIDQSLPDQVVGRMVVFSADEHISTAVMVDQSIDVRVGDRITSRLD